MEKLCLNEHDEYCPKDNVIKTAIIEWITNVLNSPETDIRDTRTNQVFTVTLELVIIMCLFQPIPYRLCVLDATTKNILVTGTWELLFCKATQPSHDYVHL